MNLLEWYWLKELYRFQVPSSTTHLLYTVLCVHTPGQVSFRHHLLPLEFHHGFINDLSFVFTAPLLYCCHVSVYANSYAAGIHHHPWNSVSSMKQKSVFLTVHIQPKRVCALLHAATRWPQLTEPHCYLPAPSGTCPVFSHSTAI